MKARRERLESARVLTDRKEKVGYPHRNLFVRIQKRIKKDLPRHGGEGGGRFFQSVADIVVSGDMKVIRLKFFFQILLNVDHFLIAIRYAEIKDHIQRNGFIFFP